MVANYVSGAHAVLFCYDITNFESFANLEDWHRLVSHTIHGQKKPYMAIVGNKSESPTFLFFNLTAIDATTVDCTPRKIFDKRRPLDWPILLVHQFSSV